MWKFKFEAEVGGRILRYGFFGVTHFSNNNGWFCRETKRWTNDFGRSGACTTDTQPKSFKAFKRYLNRHSELKVCGEIILVSRFIGHDISAIWEEPLPRFITTEYVGRFSTRSTIFKEAAFFETGVTEMVKTMTRGEWIDVWAPYDEKKKPAAAVNNDE